jgi:nitroreductase
MKWMGGPIHFMKTSEAAAPYVQRLGFSEGYELLYAIAVGYPDESPEAKPRDAEKIRFVE